MREGKKKRQKEGRKEGRKDEKEKRRGGQEVKEEIDGNRLKLDNALSHLVARVTLCISLNVSPIFNFVRPVTTN